MKMTKTSAATKVAPVKREEGTDDKHKPVNKGKSKQDGKAENTEQRASQEESETTNYFLGQLTASNNEKSNANNTIIKVNSDDESL